MQKNKCGIPLANNIPSYVSSHPAAPYIKVKRVVARFQHIPVGPQRIHAILTALDKIAATLDL